MINGTGKQAIKNRVAPVTISFARPSVIARWGGRDAPRDPPKTPHARATGGK